MAQLIEKKNNIQNLGSINPCFISENPWLKNFAKKTQGCRFVVRIYRIKKSLSTSFKICANQCKSVAKNCDIQNGPA